MTSSKSKKSSVRGIKIRSMTGFGKASEKSPYGLITAEIKTLNHKNLSVSCNPFNGFFLIEEKLQGIIAKKLFRGKTFVKITREDTAVRKNMTKVVVNEGLAKEYISKITKMQKKLSVDGQIFISDLISFPGIVESTDSKSSEKIWPYVEKAVSKALDKLIDFRKKEGARLANDFIARLKRIEKSIKKINKYGKESVATYRKKLVKSIREITADEMQPDKGRLETEVALFARNCDIAEELTRLSGHLIEFKDAMKKVSQDAGKKLDFIAQEMQREANTIGSKSSDFRISKAIIEVKSEVEKIREQIRNVE